MFQYGAIESDGTAVKADSIRRALDWRPATPGATLTRVIDMIVAAAALIFLSPLFLPIALLIKLQDGGSVFFAHPRIGLGGRTFACLKFRSMVTDAEVRLVDYLAKNPQANLEWAQDQKLRHDPRITLIGAFLRKSSLDELPQLINVLRGDMSIVGPRPIVQAEIRRYGRSFRHYTSVRPGITGLWQVSGRNDVSYSRRVALDRTYARMRSFNLYVGIILKTVPAVLNRSGSY